MIYHLDIGSLFYVELLFSRRVVSLLPSFLYPPILSLLSSPLTIIISFKPIASARETKALLNVKHFADSEYYTSSYYLWLFIATPGRIRSPQISRAVAPDSDFSSLRPFSNLFRQTTCSTRTAIIPNMTSPAEQMFLFGEIIDPGPISVLALFGYADLTAGSAIIFATINISAYIASNWKFLSPWISALLTAVVRPIRAVVVDTSWVLMQLAAVRSLDDVFTTLRNLEDGVKSRIVESRPSRSVCVVVNWYFPFNCPLATVCRLSLSFICATTVYGLFLPAA